MKTLNIVLSFLFVLAAMVTVKAQKYPVSAVKKETIKVWGECGTCKKKIEKASLAAGALTSNWDEDTKLLSVSFIGTKTNMQKIEETIAAAGYDTKNVTAANNAYNKLPACCKYERKEIAQQEVAGCCDNNKACTKDASCCKDGKCVKTNEACKDMAACKEKGCCKS